MKSRLFLFFIIQCYFAQAQLTNLQGINQWAYQLQNTTPAAIAPDNSYQLFVTDYSANGNSVGAFTPQQVTAMKTGGKKVIAYISIGEAEDYRDYWQPGWNTNPPAWLGPENLDWQGNYKVKFWQPGWQQIIYTYIDTLLAKGYDGIYMDIIDAYYYWQEENPQQPFADTLMMDFVGKIRHRVDSVLGNSAFIILPQNAEDIIDAPNVSPAMVNKYFSYINGIGVEDVFFTGNNDMNNNYAPDTYRIGLLNEFKNRGKRVLSIEYIDEPAKLTQYTAAALASNYVPYACYRALDMICTQLPLNVDVEKAPKPIVFTTENSTTITLPYTADIYLVDMQGRVVGLRLNTNYASFTGLQTGLYILQHNFNGKTLFNKVLIAN